MWALILVLLIVDICVILLVCIWHKDVASRTISYYYDCLLSSVSWAVFVIFLTGGGGIDHTWGSLIRAVSVLGQEVSCYTPTMHMVVRINQNWRPTIVFWLHEGGGVSKILSKGQSLSPLPYLTSHASPPSPSPFLFLPSPSLFLFSLPFPGGLARAEPPVDGAGILPPENFWIYYAVWCILATNL